MVDQRTARVRASRRVKVRSDGSNPCSASPSDLASRYRFPRSLSGQGECIAILSFGGGISVSDLTRYFEQRCGAVPDVRYQEVTAANRPNRNSHYDLELAMDIQVAARLAPGARVVVYFGSNDANGWVDTVSRAIYDRANQPSVLSISWGATEDWWPTSTIGILNDLFRDAARLGITICAASGNRGCAWDSEGHCRVIFPASSPFALSCGGTMLQSGGAEVVWNVRNEAASGGGISDRIPRPLWQPPLADVFDRSLPSRRNPHFDGRRVPDVAGLASPFHSVYVGGSYHNGAGGTSAVAPLWAALIARLNEGLRKQGQRPVGHLHPTLYADPSVQETFSPIHYGHNDPFGRAGYEGHSGWNACAGWGTPNGDRLLAALRNSRCRTENEVAHSPADR